MAESQRRFGTCPTGTKVLATADGEEAVAMVVDVAVAGEFDFVDPAAHVVSEWAVCR